MTDDRWNSSDESLLQAKVVDEACDRFEAAWRSGGQPKIEAIVESVKDEHQESLLAELLQIEVFDRIARDETPLASEYFERFPQLDHEWFRRLIEQQLAAHARNTKAPDAHAPDSSSKSRDSTPETERLDQDKRFVVAGCPARSARQLPSSVQRGMFTFGTPFVARPRFLPFNNASSSTISISRPTVKLFCWAPTRKSHD